MQPSQAQRFAIYLLPEPGPLADFGASWLGWDVETGAGTPHPDLPGLPLSPAELTHTPRKYGFHGTIKPPFHLKAGESPEALRAAFADLCALSAPVDTDGLQLVAFGRFLALTLRQPSPGLDRLAARMVRDLDRFRAPASAAELARRRARPLRPSQEDNLIRWGYPDVMDEFRFHITLTSKLAEDSTRTTALAALKPHLEPLLSPFPITSLCLCGSDPDGRFHLIERRALSGPEQPPEA